MSITIDQLQRLDGHGKVVTDQGDKVGGIGQVYVDDTTGAPNWVTVKTGLFGAAETFVPVENARLDGHDIVVGYSKDTIKAAPRVDADGSITPEEEQTLYRHYGLGGSDVTTAADLSGRSAGRDRSAGWDGVGDAPSDLDDPSEVGDHRPDLSDKTVGQDRSGPTTDTAMTRSEERLQVGTQVREAGRARMRKYVVTERVTQTVPVSHDEVHVVREPITDANRGPAMSGPAISEEEHEVVLNAETAVVAKETVPVERVRLSTTTVTGQETVSADVRKEQIELDDPTEVEAKAKGGKSRH
ncbi:MAG: DUF2382 domain-containing protein [Janthinobacterium lividum]